VLSEPTVGLRAVNAALESYEILQSAGIRSESSPQGTLGGTTVSWYPAEPWSEPAAFSQATAIDEVLLLDLGAEIVATAHETLVPLLAQANGPASETLAGAVREFRKDLHAALSDLGVPLGSDGPSDVIVTPPGYASTSFNYAERRYMGLHVDQHDGLPLGQRSEARRLCVLNIGWAHRYLNVYPYRLTDLCQAAGVELGLDGGGLPSREVTARFFAGHGEARILRIRLEPGQGYVFNTQDVVHDGATPDGDVPGVAFHSMGTWARADAAVR
jgi:hypothetical protein